MSGQIHMDALAYSSRMLDWAPLGKLFLVISLLIVNLLANTVIVPVITLLIGLALLFYSTRLRFPFIIGFALAQAMLIMLVGFVMISILGTGDTDVIWNGDILWVQVNINYESFNLAVLVFIRAIAGVMLMLSFASSTPVPHLAHALTQLRLPKELTEIVILVYRYSFLLLERMETMWRAANGRLGFNGYRRSFHTTAGIAMGIFISSMDLAERSQGALDSRNYDGTFPIYNMPNRIDWIWVAAILCLATVLHLLGLHAADWLNIAELVFGRI